MEKYTATGYWDGEHWVVSMDKSPHFGTVSAEGHSRTEAHDGATELMAILLGHRDFVVTVDFREKSNG